MLLRAENVPPLPPTNLPVGGHFQAERHLHIQHVSVLQLLLVDLSTQLCSLCFQAQQVLLETGNSQRNIQLSHVASFSGCWLFWVQNPSSSIGRTWSSVEESLLILPGKTLTSHVLEVMQHNEGLHFVCVTSELQMLISSCSHSLMVFSLSPFRPALFTQCGAIAFRI